MDFQVTEQTIGVSAPLFEGRGEQSVDADLTLPEYCPDAQRVLKCMLVPNVRSVQIGNGRVTADCSAVLRVLYCGEDGRVHCYEQNYPFSQEVSVPGVQAGDCATVHAETSYVNCRIVSPRRMDIHGMVHCLFRVRRRKEQPVISGVSGCGVQIKTASCRVVSAAGEAAKSFPVAEVVELAAEAPPVRQVLHTQGTAVASDIKAITNKLLFKGELQLKIFYLADNDSSEPAVLDYAIPLSQIVEVDGIDEDCSQETILSVPSLELTPRADASGERRLLDVNASVLADIRATRELELPIAVDAYSTQSELDTEYRNMEFLQPLDSFAEKLPVTGSVPVPGGAKELLGIWSGDPVSEAQSQGKELAVFGTVPMYILYTDGAGETAFCEKPLEFRFRRAINQAVQRLKCRPRVTLINLDFTSANSGEIQVRADLDLTVNAYDLRERRVIVGLQPDENRPKADDLPALTLYYADPGESIWDIARTYNTTVDSIVQENAMVGEILPEQQMLLIPRV
ncbi:MAG: DUF3794 domain-containing protein [Oscillospiraceae bacterium]|jgi:hypothetical protein|nr:DUF3794 domain-containing protein [Oscillospiraceae bacterium]